MVSLYHDKRKMSSIYKYWTRHNGFLQNDVSNFLFNFVGAIQTSSNRPPVFVNDPYESLTNQGLFACLFDSNGNCNSHINHGVVTCADETHHFCALVSFGRASERDAFREVLLYKT